MTETLTPDRILHRARRYLTEGIPLSSEDAGVWLGAMLDLVQRDDVEIPQSIVNIFVPPKSPNEIDDDQLLELPATIIIAKLMGLTGHRLRGACRSLYDDTYGAAQDNRIARAIRVIFDKLKGIGQLTLRQGDNPRSNPDVAALLDVLIAEDNLTADVEEINITRDGGHRLRRSRRRHRFGHADYARLEGYGEDPSSYLGQAAVAALGGRYGGGFVMHKQQMRTASKNGWYEFRILPGNPDNEVCSLFRAELHQTTDDGVAHPVIAYPPSSGDKRSLAVSANIVEVPSMSRMMRESALAGAQTPAVVFDLVNIDINEGEPTNGWEPLPVIPAPTLS